MSNVKWNTNNNKLLKNELFICTSWGMNKIEYEGSMRDLVVG